MLTGSETIVVFVDLLGFTALLEKYELEPEVFEELQRPGNVEFLRASLETMEATPLSERFIRFHLLLADAVRITRLVHDCSVITFSDSAFLATANLSAAIDFACSLMHHALADRVPLRFGIAAGGFLVVRAKADFGMTMGDHAMQFLGSGVSRAYLAESCGVKGMRILLHPSTYALLDAPEHQPMVKSPHGYRLPIPVGDSEATNRASVDREVNYLWHPRHDETIRSGVLMLRDASPDDQHHHYSATLLALDRMRAVYGRPPFNLLADT
jgi:class 3 adenylate cyclase